jgi:bifunctional non-homologous end joining protein LigD
LRAAALSVRDLLEELELPSFIKTSGSKGFHILVPLEGEIGFETTWRFAHGAGAVLVKRHPRSSPRSSSRPIAPAASSWTPVETAPGATFAAVYAVRPKPGAPVSAPCTWQEVERGVVGPRTFTLRTMAGRTREVGDLWSAMQGQGRSLHAAMAKLEGLLSEADWKEALAASTRRPVSRKPSRKG